MYKRQHEELQVLEGAVQDVLSRTTDAFRKADLHLASKVEPMETVVDELVRAIKARHVARLQAGSCSIEYGFVLEDLLTNYERVCDHCSNVAVAQIEVAQDSFDTHAKIPEHFANVDASAKEGGHVAFISVGWDPGMFSLQRLIGNCILPNGKDYTFWGRGVSQGHSCLLYTSPSPRD